jgi:hypothetical protein
MSSIFSAQLITRLWTLGALLLWGGLLIGFGLIRFDTFGLDEGAATALLLNWSVSDQIASPVTTFGGPDFRALLFIPLGLYWSGSMLAAKVFMILVTFGAVLFLYHWQRKRDEESALIATGLLLVAPVTITLVDALGSGPFVLLMFALGWLLDRKYRASPHRISSLYFVQTLLVAITVTLHPMGLAYPAALAWHWHKNPKSEKQKQQVWAGIAIATGIILAMQTGWIALDWGANPLQSLAFAVLGQHLEMDAAWAVGLIPAILLMIVLIKTARGLLDDLLGTMLLGAALLGLMAADENWAFLALALLFFAGIPLLIRANATLGKQTGFLGQRGLMMLALIISATVFMQADRAHGRWIARGDLSPEDELIQRLAVEAEDTNKPFLAASPWPARTMIVCRRDVLPLPPAAKDGPALLQSIKGLTHVIYDHNDPENWALSENFSQITDATETLAVLPGGVIIRIREAAKAKPLAAMPAPAAEGDGPAMPEKSSTPK